MKKSDKKIVRAKSLKFLLVLPQESADNKAIAELGKTFEVLLASDDKNLKDEFNIFCVDASLKKMQSIELWMPYVQSKIAAPAEPYLFEISTLLKKEEIAFAVQMAYYLEADGFWVNNSNWETVVEIIGDYSNLFLKPMPDALYKSNADVFRQQIDAVDLEIVQLLKERSDLVACLADLKNQYHLTMLQHERWNTSMEKRLKRSDQMNLDKALTRQLFDLIHKAALDIHLKRYFKK